MSDPTEHFRMAMAVAGLTPPEVIHPDGAIHRFSTSGRHGDDSGWYLLHTDGVPSGSFGDWRTGQQSTWCSKATTNMTQAERDAHRQRVEAMRLKRELETAQRQESAAADAERRWQAAKPCTGNAYLTAKSVQPHCTRVEADGALIVPMRDAAGKLWNIERVNPVDFKDKRGLPGGRRTGCYFGIGKPGCVLIVCEGFATGASIHECTGKAVAVAFNAGNLEAVCTALHTKYPALTIIVAADNDHMTDGNPGLTKATAAALVVGGLLAVPEFSAALKEAKATDFNDLHQLAGVEAVRACFDAAKPVAPAVTEHNWPELQPLMVKFEPEPYPLDALPDAVRCAVEEVAEFVKAPIPLITTSALAALSLAIQAHTDVERAAKLHGPCSLFLLAIADSGERKSTCDGFFSAPILAYESLQQEAAKPLLVDFKSDHDAWEAQRNGLKEKIKSLAKAGKPTAEQVRELHTLDSNEPVAPRVPRLVHNDATPEGLGYELTNKWPSAGVMSSEAGSVFGGHGMGKESVMRNLAMLNLLWDGAALPVTRKSTESFSVRGARLTMALQVQEATIRSFFDGSKGLARGTGFLARFLVSWPESTQGTRHFTEAPVNWPALAVFNNRLTAILNQPAPIDGTGALQPAMLKLSPEAKAVWVAFHDAIEQELSTGGEMHDVRDVASKTPDNAVRLAALFHTFIGSIGPIGVEAMESGARLALWHLTEARRFLGELAMPLELANPARLESWLVAYCQREGTDTVPTREVQRHGPGGLRDKAVIDAAVKELTELGRARLVQDGKKKGIQVNPALLRGAE